MIDPISFDLALGTHGLDARKRAYQFSDRDKYEVFLKQQLLNLEPQYYGVSKHELLMSKDGPMCRLCLISDLADPSLEVVAECLINNQYVYLWRDSVWTLGVGERSEPLRKFFGMDFVAVLSDTAIGRASTSSLSVVIYPIGTTPAWMQETDDDNL